ncbi:MAG: nicotinamide mononucleotide transporter [Bacteroidia bacterium]|nr:nicotinamide mononucleotide transporter [Bacteroidia bacterium]
MEFLNWIALITGVLGVLLTIRQTIWCWPMALISVVISIIAFYQERLLGDMFLNIFYFFSGIYGWYYWNRKKDEQFIVSKTPKKLYLFLFVITLVQVVLYYFILHFFKSDKIVFDSILTACSFTCTYMMIKKWIENWIFWLLIDGSYIMLYLVKDMPTYALLYAFFSIMVIYGYWQWKKQLNA